MSTSRWGSKPTTSSSTTNITTTTVKIEPQDNKRIKLEHDNNNNNDNNISSHNNTNYIQQHKHKHNQPTRQPSNINPNIKYEWGSDSSHNSNTPHNTNQTIVKQQPNYNLTGLLNGTYKEPNSINTNSNDNNTSTSSQNNTNTIVKYSEPTEGRKPDTTWFVYTYENDKLIDKYKLTQSYTLVGNDKNACQVYDTHSSIATLHAVIQFRLKTNRNITGDKITHIIKPYIIDINSKHKTYLNKQAIEPQRYYELLNNDVIQFGISDRRYVLLAS